MAGESNGSRRFFSRLLSYSSSPEGLVGLDLFPAHDRQRGRSSSSTSAQPISAVHLPLSRRDAGLLARHKVGSFEGVGEAISAEIVRVLTTETLVAEKPEKKAAPASGGMDDYDM